MITSATLWFTIGLFSALALCFGLILGFASEKFKVKSKPACRATRRYFTANAMWSMWLSWL